MSWTVQFSNSKQLPYFINQDTKESRWDPPSGMSVEDALKLPGASKYLNADGSPKPPPGSIRASHLLVKHNQSRRPASWKSDNITLSKEEAIEILRGYQADIQASANPAQRLGEIALAESDCSSHSKNGDLGVFGPGMMQRPFEEAAYALQPGEISDVVSTDSGVHLILRTA